MTSESIRLPWRRIFKFYWASVHCKSRGQTQEQELTQWPPNQLINQPVNHSDHSAFHLSIISACKHTCQSLSTPAGLDQIHIAHTLSCIIKLSQLSRKSPTNLLQICPPRLHFKTNRLNQPQTNRDIHYLWAYIWPLIGHLSSMTSCDIGHKARIVILIHCSLFQC